jgi:hypothetical protein
MGHGGGTPWGQRREHARGTLGQSCLPVRTRAEDRCRSSLDSGAGRAGSVCESPNGVLPGRRVGSPINAIHGKGSTRAPAALRPARPAILRRGPGATHEAAARPGINAARFAAAKEATACGRRHGFAAARRRVPFSLSGGASPSQFSPAGRVFVQDSIASGSIFRHDRGRR